MSNVLRAHLKRAAAVTLVPIALLAAAAQPAQAAVPNVACSDTLTKNTVLTADLYCPNTGVKVSPGVTFDLGGHIYSSNNVEVERYTMIWGALDAPGAKVVNGTLKNWRQIDVSSTNTEFNNVQVQNSTIFAQGTFRIANSRVTGSSIIGFSTKITVELSTLGDTSLDGENNTISIRRSTVRDSRFFPVSNDTLNISGSTLSRTQVPCQTNLSILNSTINQMASGPAVVVQNDGCKAVISGSTFQNNAGAIDSTTNGGAPGTAFTVRSSRFVNNGNAVVVDKINLTNSTFTRNATAVTIIDAKASSVSGSTFTKNTRHGVYANAAGLRLKNNTAIDNGQIGIYAPGAVDQGGNIARGNKSGNCIGVICKAR